MKADSSIKRELRRLRQTIESPDTDNLTKRVAWEIEQAIRWAREDVRGWATPTESAFSGANLIREEARRGEIKL